MRYCDLTFAYTPTSGGIRTFIDQKRRHLLSDPTAEHVLIVPGENDSVVQHGRSTVYTLASPFIPGCEPYRTFIKPRALLDALRHAAPDVIELGTFFVEPWAAFRYRDEVSKSGGRCVVGGYFHTDIAEAYFGAPIKGMVASWGESVASWGTRLADLIETGATSYFGSLFRKCDLMCAATPVQMNRLAEYGVTRAHWVPLGVDLERFQPERRSDARRAALGAARDSTVLVYAGRLDREKNVHLLLDAFERIRGRDVCLWMIGEGPERGEVQRRAAELPGVHVLPYESDPDVLAEILASADIYVTAGPHETFGLSVVEGQASGLPVVGVEAGALIERVEAGTGLLVTPGDADAFAQAIGVIAPRAREMGMAARSRVIAAGLGWASTFARWRDAYQSAWLPLESVRPVDAVPLPGACNEPSRA